MTAPEKRFPETPETLFCSAEAAMGPTRARTATRGAALPRNIWGDDPNGGMEDGIFHKFVCTKKSGPRLHFS